MNLNIDLIKNHPSAIESIKIGDYHQAILDVGYSHWQSNLNWDYSDMVDNAEKLYGNLAKLLILLGKYNQQVCNGGHIQYYDNGYADGSGGCFSHKTGDMPLHDELIDLFKQSPLKDLPHGQQVLTLLESFDQHIFGEDDSKEPCFECHGSGETTYYNENDEEEQEETCDSCGGTGEIEYDTYDKSALHTMDSQYYEFNDIWMKEINTFLSNLFNTTTL